jgi:hypothetical protein
MLKQILEDASSLVSLMVFGATLLVWCAIIATWH